MDKLISLVLIALIANIVNGEMLCSDYQIASKYPDLEFDEDFCSILVPTDGYTHCCYVEINDSPSGCLQLKDDQYENIKRYIDQLEAIDSSADIKIDCSSKYLTISLFAVFALLF